MRKHQQKSIYYFIFLIMTNNKTEKIIRLKKNKQKLDKILTTLKKINQNRYGKI